MEVKQRYSKILFPSTLSAQEESQRKVFVPPRTISDPRGWDWEISQSPPSVLEDLQHTWGTFLTLYLCVHANFVENSIWRDEQDLQRLFALSTDPRIPSPCILVLQRERLQAGDERALARRVNLCLQKWQLQVKDLDVHDWLRSALGKKIDKYFAFSSRI